MFALELFALFFVVSLIGSNFPNKCSVFFSKQIRDAKIVENEYDFVIIGAGSGGCVVANRLSENRNWSVLILEAGGDEGVWSDFPLLGALQSLSSYSWGYKTEKMKKACLGMVDQRCNIQSGKVLGGSSVINFLLYNRGNKHDYNEWESKGNIDWNYQNVLPYFIKSENFSKHPKTTQHFEEINERFHGFSGPLNVEIPFYEYPIVEEFLKVAQNFGYENNDPNSDQQLGASRVQATMLDGIRCSASKAYLRPIADRKNLQVSIESRATKILIDPETKKAVGVEFFKNGKRLEVKVRKEVILAAGSINSPQLLMVSGIGPKIDLERLGIPILADLKVGFNLQDHVVFSDLLFLVNDTVTYSLDDLVDIFQLFNGSGPLTIPGGAEAVCFLKTNNDTKEYPDVELVLGASGYNSDYYGVISRILNVPDETFRKLYENIRGKPSFSLSTILLRPKSRGRITLRDADPFSLPLIDLNYFDDPNDIEVMIEGVKKAILIGERIEKYDSKLHKVSIPACEHYVFATNSYWRCALQHMAHSLLHLVGTCKMGPTSDSEAVVDAALRVHRIENLRVIDGSVMPEIIAGHPNAPIIMMAEKASDLIKGSWQLKQSELQSTRLFE